MLEYKKENRTVYNEMDQICKDKDLYPYVKKQTQKGMAGEHFMPSFPGD